MLYEDLIYLWLAFIIYELIPSFSYKFSFFFLLFLFFSKEIIFVSVLLITRKNLHKFNLSFSSFLEKLFMSSCLIFYIIDLSLLNLKANLEKLYFSSLIGILWFLHYMFLVKFLLLRFTFNYLKILIGIIIPVLILVIVQEIFDIIGLTFQGDIFLLLVLILFISPFLMVRVWPVETLKNTELREIILKFLRKNRVKIAQIYVLKNLGKNLYTAGIIGFLPPFKYLFFSKPLLEILSPEEILGVVAHEIAHLKKKHNLWLLLLLLNLPLFLLTISILIFWLGYHFNPDLVKAVMDKERLPLSVEIFLGISLIILSYIYIRYLFSYFLRQFEREADLYSGIILNTYQPIISALFKIGEITGQLYKKSWHHYGIFERIEFLKKVAMDVELLNRVKKKFLKIRIILILWIILNLMIILGISYTEKILENLIRFFSL